VGVGYAVGETVVAHIGFIREVVVLEFTVTNTHYAVDACPVYYGITAGPAYRLNDWASIYGVVGVGYGKFQNNNFRSYRIY
jgi:opacity protein-like surface antigen